MKTLLLFLLFIPLHLSALEYYTNEKTPGVLLVEGTIQQSEVDEFSAQVLAKDVHTVSFNSTGGNFITSVRIGKFLREMNINTTILNGNRCSSACTYAFMGGAERSIEDGAKFAMHRPYFKEDMTGTYIEGYDVGVILSVTATTHLIRMGFDPVTANLHLMSKRLKTFTSVQQRDLSIITARE
jgi:hypothetical protein